MESLVVFVLLYLQAVTVTCAGRNETQSGQCSCGFRDPTTKELYTDSIILYFNETSGVPQDVFNIRDYSNNNQKGWNVIFPQGARPDNVRIGNNGSQPWQDATDGTDPRLEMMLDPIRMDHLSNGAEIQSLRRDLMYGTFRSEMRSAPAWVGGSAMSMFLRFNDSQSAGVDLLNMDTPDAARVLQTINGEYPEYELSTNYTSIEMGDPPKIPARSPYTFMELRIDWTADTLDFWINNNRTRHVTKDDRTLPSTPQAIHFGHWSTGDRTYMQGPPVNGSIAQVKWVRAFFNSSVMSATDHQEFDDRCPAIEACSVDDMTLRGSTQYTSAAIIPWKPTVPHQHIRDVAGYVAAACSVIGVISLINAFVRRGPWHTLKNMKFPGSKRASTHALRKSLRESIGPETRVSWNLPHMLHMTGIPEEHGSGVETPAPGYTSQPSYAAPYNQDGVQTPLPEYQIRQSYLSGEHALVSMYSRQALGYNRNASAPHGSKTPSFEQPSNLARARVSESHEEDYRTSLARDKAYLDLAGGKVENDDIRPVGNSADNSSRGSVEDWDRGEKKHESFMNLNDDETVTVEFKSSSKNKKPTSIEIAEAPQDYRMANAMKDQTGVPDAMTGGATAEPIKEQQPIPKEPQKRIDYLAGLVAISCIMVTVRHFSLTFWPYVTVAQGQLAHFQADRALSYVLGPYVLTPLWIGPFFVTSCRFLAQRYLRTGNLDDIANKMLLRAPRMLIPCFVFMTLTYFLLSLGLTSRLEWLPSVSFSTWPYVKPQGNFGIFINELVELSYLIPNAAPGVINHYCVGVLWTIPVQLHYSFVTLLATVLIKDIKTPWKRFGFYTLTILCGWYATSWSACHWLGLMLADLDITYNWKPYIQGKWYRLYPMLFFATGLTLATPLVLLFNTAIYSFPFMAWENAIHPDPVTGRPIFETIPSIYAAYPEYYAPNLAMLTFSAGLQLIVELSTWTQKFLSIPLITFFHPHIMTIYLSHGFVFWSLGATVAVWLSNLNVPYWGNLLITAVCCYSVMLVFTVIITPLIEVATKGSTKNIWRWATEEPVPHRPTTAPFSKQLVLGRGDQKIEEENEMARRPSRAA